MLVSFCMLLSGVAFGEGLTVTYQASESANAVVRTSTVEGVTYLFLPSSASVNQLALNVDAQGTIIVTGQADNTAIFTSGEAVDIAALFPDTPEDGHYNITLTAEDGATQIALPAVFGQYPLDVPDKRRPGKRRPCLAGRLQ